uniref:POU domain, class 6, transcription factor 1 isoform X2 n=1 Tax=Doryrhamphus excisus TaxID=161450 RepID=UPI0025AEC736|nr:POU domain, class 6, transcription factor 1 isoform X2 [Doryrhamphus excisus]XP_057907707.1 POU domain, class 6, transcription factor 1 isoform X2 [Doryrhamphus excisus]XP_057907710.1 POU domain, class 6, transcription factor 1 isoform X2 [Doryrhamphus excisus]
MKSQDLPARDAPPLTVNEQVIVMSGQETIRVLEVEVDASSSSVPEGKRSEGKADEGGAPPEGSHPRDDQAAPAEVPPPAAQTVAPTVPISVSLPAPPPAAAVAVQGCPQVLSQESLATLMTAGMLAQTGSLGQPLLIPIGGQGGLAVLTLPTTNVATLSGLAAATTQPGNLLKLPFAGLQAATVLNSVHPQLQTSTQGVFQSPAASMQPVQTTLQQPPPTSAVNAPAAQEMATSVAAAAAQASAPTPTAAANLSVAALQTAGLSINPALISATSLGAQTQFLSSLTSSPIITSTMSNMAGITSQILTTAQGQVIGTLPLLVNPASLAGGAATPALPLQGLQVQTVTPQLLLNTQGQIIAAVGNGAATAAALAASAAVLPKAAAPPAASKATPQLSAASQSPVIIAPQPSPLKSATTPPSAAPVTCADMAKVGQLVSKPHLAPSGEEGINLEEIREFAKNFKIRRLSLGLTQTQVGQALTATEGPAYSQSAICRFEKLDITPKSAQKLKPVLEKWLAEAEHWNQKGQQNLMEFVGGEPSKKRKRRTSFTPQAIEVLNSYFEKNSLPTGQEITEIAKELNYDREVVRVWFCNRRQTLKNTSKINIFQVQ